jgi:hypothetical protein
LIGCPKGTGAEDVGHHPFSNPGYNLTGESAMTTPAKPRPNSWQKSGSDTDPNP